VRAQLERILADFATSGANRRSRLLRYLVERTLEDRSESLKESVIATEVFDRAPDYDPQIDSVVRVEVGRLRARLAEYYEKAGVDASKSHAGLTGRYLYFVKLRWNRWLWSPSPRRRLAAGSGLRRE
jgi:hypothetical protein